MKGFSLLFINFANITAFQTKRRKNDMLCFIPPFYAVFLKHYKRRRYDRVLLTRDQRIGNRSPPCFCLLNNPFWGGWQWWIGRSSQLAGWKDRWKDLITITEFTSLELFEYLVRNICSPFTSFLCPTYLATTANYYLLFVRCWRTSPIEERLDRVWCSITANCSSAGCSASFSLRVKPPAKPVK